MRAGPGGEQEQCYQGAGCGDAGGDQAATGIGVQERQHPGVVQAVRDAGRPGLAELLGGDRGAADRPLAAVTAPAGSPVGRVATSRLAYRDAATLPVTATPKVPPNSLVEPLTAGVMPACCLATAPMMASVAGAWVSPIPAPNTTIWAASTPEEVVLDTVAIYSSAAQNDSSPPAT